MKGSAKTFSVERLLSPTGTPLLPLEKKILQNLKVLRPVLKNKKLLLAVSGGLDSMALLHVFQTLKSRLEVALHIIHIDHGVRGGASSRDAKRVCRAAKSFKIPVTVKKLSGVNKSASENILRDKRYENFAKVRDSTQSSLVVTAHHLDDLLETRLIKLLQGTSQKGLLAMVPLSKAKIFRPFLEITKAEIELYAGAAKIDWSEDETNRDVAKLRNWVRRKWLGVLRADHPEYVPNLSKSLKRIAESDFIEPFDVPQEELPRSLACDERYVHIFLAANAKRRVTSRDVLEFIKRLTSKRKKFTFRLAGVDWSVTEQFISPNR